ncbi:hypothetical protein SLE2022_194320 [Rubroshorea leprosula]
MENLPPVPSSWVSAHGRHLKGRRQIHSSGILLLIVRTAQWSSLLEAVHESNRLPIEVVLALNGEQRVDPEGSLYPQFPTPPEFSPETEKQRH